MQGKFYLAVRFVFIMKSIYFLLLLLAFCQRAQASGRDTIPVYFATGKSVLTEGVQNGILNYMHHDILKSGQKLQIVGYADFVGTNQSNDALSKARAAVVKRFLMRYGFKEQDITICMGKGEIERTGISGEDGFPRDRRVDIVIDPKPVEPPVVVAKAAAAVIPPKQIMPPTPPAAPKKVITIEEVANARPNETIRIENLYFYPGRHVIRPESLPVLDRLKVMLEKTPKLKIGIEGHICCTDPRQGDALDYDTRDLALSVNRAKEVYTFLIRKDIEEDRLSYKGFGATRKLVEEHTEEDADKNRRVEIRVLEN